MKDKFIASLVFLIVILCVSLTLALFIPKLEAFSGLFDLSNPGSFPKSLDQAILNDYPLINKNQTSNNNYNQIWWHYPIFQVGSYKQITNNMKYPNNPDEGTCTTAEFCGALYKENPNNPTNYYHPLPPVMPTSENEVRVNYYNAKN